MHPYLPIASYFLVLLGFNLWSSTFHVHVIERHGLSNFEISLLFSLTSIPGLLAMFAVPFYRLIRPQYVMALLCIITAGALLLIANVSTWLLLIPGVLAISCGQALSYPVNSGLCMSLTTNRVTAQDMLARMRSFGPVAALCAAASVLLLEPLVGYQNLVLIAVTPIVIFAAYLYQHKNLHALDKERVQLKIKTYLWPYYALNFLSGARSALFRAFVITLLVREHDFDMQRTSGLIMASTVAGFAGYRIFAWLSTRVEPKYVLGVVHTTVGFLFIGFAIIDNPIILVLLFLIDSTIFGVSVVTDSTLRTMVEPGKLIGHISTGMSLFFVAGALTPIAGGLIATTWTLTSVFIFAATIAWTAAIISQVYCRRAAGIAVNEQSTT